MPDEETRVGIGIGIPMEGTVLLCWDWACTVMELAEVQRGLEVTGKHEGPVFGHLGPAAGGVGVVDCVETEAYSLSPLPPELPSFLPIRSEVSNLMLNESASLRGAEGSGGY